MTHFYKVRYSQHYDGFLDESSIMSGYHRATSRICIPGAATDREIVFAYHIAYPRLVRSVMERTTGDYSSRVTTRD
ncbi:hypothetical protein P7H17_16560 [Paenibacillus larvae]|nr:hypothetical protein [Paenibacillus larvae]MDT2287320.1 hypothetical protein [Paenibacillus larvae]